MGCCIVHRKSFSGPVRLLAVVGLLLVLPGAARADGFSFADNALRQGWSLLTQKRFAEAEEAFGRISPDTYDLGDYVLYFTGVARVRAGEIGEGAGILERLAVSFPGSPLYPYLAHELAFAAAKAGDLPSARTYFAISRGNVRGNGRKAAEGYVAACLSPDGNGRAAAEAHLENFSAYPVQEGAKLSMQQLWEWRGEGKWTEWGLPASFYDRYAKALLLVGEDQRARAVFRDALDRFPEGEDFRAVALDYAEFLRRRGERSAATALLSRAEREAPPEFRSEAEFLLARIDWADGRTADALRRFLAIAKSDAPRDKAELARYQAAWILDGDGDLDAAAEQFGKLLDARDERVRRESAFRHAFELYRQERYARAIPAFARGEEKAASSVERGRYTYWTARALDERGDQERAAALLRGLAADPDAGIFAILADARLGGKPFAMLGAPSSGETASLALQTDGLWESFRGAGWSAENAEKVRRAERLAGLGLVEYAVLEADRVDRGAVVAAAGPRDGATPGLFRYLVGDLRGAIRDTAGVPTPAGDGGLIARLQYPLAPQYLGDCDAKRSGVDTLVLHAVIRQESRFQYNALSPAGAVGLMQLMPGTAAAVARDEKIRKDFRRDDLLDPGVNVALGAAYLSRLLRRYDGDYLRAVAAYNAGETAVARWWAKAGADPAMFLEQVTYRETRSYLRKVFFNVLQYYRIYRPGMLARFVPSAQTGGGTARGVSSSPRVAGTPGATEAGSPATDAPEDETSGD